jgi:uncharacterized protein CbrC (UPF0167 family)
MPQLIKAQYEKFGATFATGDEAHADKNSLFTPEFTASVNDSYSNMLAEGILLEPVYATWDQETFVLSVCKDVISAEAYKENVAFDGPTAVDFAEEAGWTFLGVAITDI